MVKYFKIFFLLIGSIFLANRSSGQVYPIQVTAQIVPPFTPYLSDYTAPGSQKFMVHLRVTDPTVPDYTCKLRLTIEGVNITIRTKPSFAAPPLVLQGGGIPQIFYGEDLLDYFNPNALDFSGISRSDYEKGAKLPEGVYRFTIEVLDYHRGTTVSNKGSAVAWVILNDPPILNLPRNDSKVKVIDPMFIPFTWTPRNTGSPNSAFTTQYKFKIVEVWPITRNPYDAFLSQPALYETTTTDPQIVYGLTEPALLPGRKYAWQVQAVDEEGRDLFKNQGKSEVFVFQFGDALGIPDGLYLQSAGPSMLNVRWDDAIGIVPDGYRIQYRLHQNRQSENWYETTSTDTWKSIIQLQGDTEYEVQVRAEQSALFSDYSAAQVFKTSPAGSNDFSCKSDVTPPPIPPGQPAQQININDVIHAGGYDVEVRKLTASAGGRFTGEGAAIVPWFHDAKLHVTFKDISVNDQLWLTDGQIVTIYNEKNPFFKSIQKELDKSDAPAVGNIAVNIATADKLVEVKDAVIVSVTHDSDGNAVVSTSDNKTQVLTKGTSYAVVDSAGNGYVIDKDGNIAKTTATEAQKAYDRGNRNYNLVIKFQKGDGTLGFDERKEDPGFAPLNSFYQQVGDKYIPWKAVTNGSSDNVDAILGDKSIDSRKIHFEVAGKTLPGVTSTDAGFKVSVPGAPEGTVDELLAIYKTSESEKDQQVLGKLNLVSYDNINKNLVVVPVNPVDSKHPLPNDLTVNAIRDGLNTTYGKALVSWNVEVGDPISVTFDKPFDDGSTGVLSNYTGDMKKVINIYGKLDDDKYYIFLINIPPVSGDKKLGYMPRSKQAGFIFMNNQIGSGAITTIAHEIGHGAFNLQHTFDEFPSLNTSGDNLMDYPNGQNLYKYQWDHIHDPQTVIGLFESDEDASSQLITKAPAELVNEDGRTITFISPAGTLVIISSYSKNLLFSYGFNRLESDGVIPGTLLSFQVNNETYSLGSATNDGIFSGYSNEAKKVYNPSDFFPDDVIAKGANVGILMLPCGDSKVYFTKFQIKNFPIERGKSTQFQKLKDFGLKPFSTQNPKINAKPYTTDDNSDLFDFADHRQELTPAIFDFLKNDCEKDYLLVKLKAAEYYSYNPQLFSSYYRFVMSASESDRSVLTAEQGDLKDLLDLFTQGETAEFWLAYLSAYKKFLLYSNQTLAARLANLSLDMRVNEWEDLLLSMGPTDYGDLTFDQRLLLLKISTKFISIGFGDNWISNLVTSTPDEQQKRLLDALVIEKDGLGQHILLPRLLSDVKGVDGQEFIDLCTKLKEWVTIYYPAPPDFSYRSTLANGKFISFDPDFWDGDALTEYFSDKGEVVLKTDFGLGRTLQVSPFEYIIVESSRDYIIGGMQLTAGAKLKMPAIYAYMIFNNVNTQHLLKAGRLAFDIALLAVGIGELNAAVEAGNTFRLTRSLADLGMGLADLTFSQVLDQSLMQTQAGQDFLDAWGNIMLAYGVLRIGDEFFNSQMSSMEKDLANMRKEKSLTDSQLDEIESAQKQLKSKLQISSKLGVVDDAIRSTASYLDELAEVGISVRQMTQPEIDALDIVKSNNYIKPQVNLAKAEVTLKNGGGYDSYATSGYPDVKKNNILTNPTGAPPPYKGNSVFEKYTSNSGGVARTNDTEVKLLEEFALKNGAKPNIENQVFGDVEGEIKLYTQLCPCESCANVMKEFKRIFPNVQLEIITTTQTSFK